MGKWKIIINAPFQGYCPASYANTYPSFGNKSMAGKMQNVDITDPNIITQGAGLANLTNGTQAGAVTTLIKSVLEVPTASLVTYAIGGNLLHKISNTTIVDDATWPVTINKAVVTGEDGEDVVKYGANLYYSYNHSGSAGDIGQYNLDATFDDDWGCYSEDTDVFTVDGWKKIKDVQVGEKIYSLNPQTQKVEITENLETIIKPYNGEMIEFKSSGIDLAVTPDHKMYAGFRKREDGKIYTEYKIVRADSLIDRTNFRLKKNAIWDGKMIKEWEIPEYDNGSVQNIIRDEKGRIISTTGKNYHRKAYIMPIRPFLRLIGFYISEGCCNKKCISLSQKTYSKGYYPIKEILDELKLNYGYYRDSFDIHDKQLTQYIKKLIPGDQSIRRIPREILDLHPSLLKELYETLMLGDGYLPTSQYFTISEGLKDDFVELVNKLGWSAKVWCKNEVGQERKSGIMENGKVRYITAKHPCYRIGVTKEKNEQRLNTHTKSVTKIHYAGNIVCLVLKENHIMLVRRNGKTVWCGNSTVPTGAAALTNNPHPMLVGGDDVMYVGNGRYVCSYNGTTLDTQALDLPTNSIVTDMVWYADYLWTAANEPNLASNSNKGAIYVWDGVASSWLSYPYIEIKGRIGALLVQNSRVFVIYEEDGAGGVCKLGVISGNAIVELTSWSGSLPLFYQKTQFKNFIAFVSDGLVYLWGSRSRDQKEYLFQYMDGGYATMGALANPFGTIYAASWDAGSNYKIAQASGYETAANWKSLDFPASVDGGRSMIDKVVLHYEATGGTGARVDVKIDNNRGTSTTLGNVQHANDSGTIVKVFDGIDIECDSFRVELDWSNGSATNPLKVRQFEILGHTLTKE